MSIELTHKEIEYLHDFLSWNIDRRERSEIVFGSIYYDQLEFATTLKEKLENYLKETK